MAIGVDESPSTPRKSTMTIQPSFATPPASPATFQSLNSSSNQSSANKEPVATPYRRARKRDRSSSSDYSPPSSVQSLDFTSCSSSITTSTKTASNPAPSQPKRRGRPPKTETRPISPTELQNMDASDARYVLMRNKNNEASRRSRINRKDRELILESEADVLSMENERLLELEQRLEQRVLRLKEALKASMLES